MNQVKPKLMLDERKEKKNKKLMLLFCIVFFVLAFVSQGQTMKIAKSQVYDPLKKQYVNVVYPTLGAQFASPTGRLDTITMTIRAEEVRKGYDEISLWVQYPLATKADSLFPLLILDFDNGYTYKFIPSHYFSNNRQMRYLIAKEAYDALKKSKFIHVEFDGICQVNCKKPNPYFKDFLSSYNK